MAEETDQITATDEKNNLRAAERKNAPAIAGKEAMAEEIATEPEEIREQIEETRRDMGETINAIQEKLSFANISEQVTEQVSEQISGAVETFKTSVSEATIGKAEKVMKNLGRQFKNTNVTKKLIANPLPLAAVGFAAGLLLFSALKKKKADDIYTRNEGFGQSRQHKAKTDTLGEKKLYENAGESAGSAYESVSETAGTAYEKLGDLSGQLRERYQQTFGGNPLTGGALALVAGAAIGLLIPTTDYENQLMGETREKLLAQAQDTARETFEKAQQALGQAKDAVTEEVKNQTAPQA